MKVGQVTKRIGEGINNFVYKQIWVGKNVEHRAVTTEEVWHDKPNQFKW